MAIIGIIAVAQNLAIGRNGQLPWHFRSDMRFFKQTTSGNAVLMGWNTWVGIGKVLPNRLNIVLSRKEKMENQPSLLLMRSCDEVLALNIFLNCDLFIIGGAKTYTQFADVIDKWIVTEIPLTIEDADVFMPADYLKSFELYESIKLEENLLVKFYQKNR